MQVAWRWLHALLNAPVPPPRPGSAAGGQCESCFLTGPKCATVGATTSVSASGPSLHERPAVQAGGQANLAWRTMHWVQWGRFAWCVMAEASQCCLVLPHPSQNVASCTATTCTCNAPWCGGRGRAVKVMPICWQAAAHCQAASAVPLSILSRRGSARWARRSGSSLDLLDTT